MKGPSPKNTRRITALLVVFSAGLIAAAPPAWQNTVTKDPPGAFPPLRSLKATYSFGWSGLTAATGEVRYARTAERTQMEATGRTVGLARALWRYDVKFHSAADASALRPIESTQDEVTRKKKALTQLNFHSTGVTRTRTENGGAAKTRDFDLPNLHDLESALLYLRSQPLTDKAVYRVIVFPTTSAYLATLTVVGREKLTVRAGHYDAIKFDLQLNKIGKTLELEPHKKFRHGTIWISDDADRMVLRAEAQIMVGTVFAELQSVKYDTPKN